MEECGEGMESRKPEDRITQPGMDLRDSGAGVMGCSDDGWDLDSREKRQGMPFQPCAGDGGEWKREEEQVERALHSLPRNFHPSWNLWRLWSYVYHAPQDAHDDQGQHTQSQRLMKPPVEIASRQVHALLRSSRPVDERDYDNDCRHPMDGLGDGSVTCAGTFFRFHYSTTNEDSSCGTAAPGSTGDLLVNGTQIKTVSVRIAIIAQASLMARVSEAFSIMGFNIA